MTKRKSSEAHVNGNTQLQTILFNNPHITSEQDKLLLTAVMAWDTKALKKLKKAGTNFSLTYKDGDIENNTLIMLAAKNYHLIQLESRQREEGVIHKTEDGLTRKDLSHSNMIGELVKGGANIMATNGIGQAALDPSISKVMRNKIEAAKSKYRIDVLNHPAEITGSEDDSQMQDEGRNEEKNDFLKEFEGANEEALGDVLNDVLRSYDIGGNPHSLLQANLIEATPSINSFNGPEDFDAWLRMQSVSSDNSAKGNNTSSTNDELVDYPEDMVDYPQEPTGELPINYTEV
ncbi:MAG: hypothetical protein P8P83_04785 [Rickettsiaceae bacterium]|nr:hypothetical protein [Rickettsiaceae bacterium]